MGQTPSGTQIDNQATLKFKLKDGRPDSSISNVVTVTVAPYGKFFLSKTVDPTVIPPGDTVTYTLVVRDTSGVPFYRVTVIDTVPSAFTIAGTSGGTVTGSVITWNVGTLSIGQSDTLKIKARAQNNLFGGTDITNICYAFDSTGIRFTAAADVQIASVPALVVAKVASKDSLNPGDSLKYTITVHNTGNTNLMQVQVLDTLPALLSNASVTNGTLNNGIVTLSLDSLVMGATDTITIKGVVNSVVEGGTVIRNSVTVKTQGLPDEHAYAQTRVETHIALAFQKSVSKDTAGIGDTLHYTVRMSNAGDVPLTGITVIDTIFNHLNVVAISPNVTLVNGVATYSRDTLNPGVADSFTVTAVITGLARGGDVIGNTAYLQSNQTPRTSSHVSTYISVLSNFVITKSVSKDTVNTGDSLRYVIRIRNSGNIALTDVIIRDILPAYLSNIGLSPNLHIGSDGSADYQLDTLGVGRSDSMTITATVASNAPDQVQIVNTVYGQTDQTPLQSAQATFVTRIFVSNHSCRITVTAVPNLVIGNGATESVITAFVGDSSGQPKPDGSPVEFRTSYGTFSNGLDTVIHPSVNGYAIDSVKYLLARPEIDTALIVVGVNDQNICAATDTIRIRFFPGAIMGTVVNRMTNSPVAGAIVQVFSSAGVLVGTDTTGANGNYEIPVPVTDTYTVTISIADNFGVVVPISSTVSVQVPGTGGVPPQTGNNAISGTIYYDLSDRPIPVPNIEITLTSLDVQKGKAPTGRKILGTTSMVDSTFTDSNGVYKFNNIPAGDFEVAIAHPTISGNNTVVNFGNGEYVIDANIPVDLSPNLVLQKTGPAVVYQHDTAQYSIHVGNVGSLVADSSILIDTLDRRMAFVSASDNGVGDTTKGTVTWNVGPLDSGYSHNFTVKVRFTTHPYIDTVNIQNTLMTNKVTLIDKNSGGQKSTSTQTDVRLVPKLRIWKTASTQNAAPGDTVAYTIHAGNTAGSVVDSLTVSDALPSEVQYVSASPAPTSYDSTTATLTWWVDSMSVGQMNIYTVKTVVRTNITPGDYSYTNVSNINWREGLGTSAQDTLSRATVSTTVSFISVSKTVEKTIVDIGDIVPYDVTVSNLSPTTKAVNVQLTDSIPFGFKYIKKSTYRDSTVIADPTGVRTLTWHLADTLQPSQSISISYRLVAGAGASQSNGVNTAQAKAKDINGKPIVSNISQAQVEVKLGVFSTHGIIIGKVFYDENENRYQDPGEMGVKGVELMMEDGTRIITGDDGKYSLPDVMPGMHVIRLRQQTLPRGATLEVGWGEFAGQASSRFVKVPESGIARADFYLKRGAPPSMKLTQRITRLSTLDIQRIAEPKNVMFIQDERQAPLKLPGSNFEVGKAILKEDAFPTLKSLAEIMIQNPEQNVAISGHTDSVRIHTAEFPSNQELSEARANAVRDYLVNVEHIDPSRITTAGFGPTVPVATNTTIEGRAANRRIELRLSGGKKAEPLARTTVLFKIPINYEGTAPVTQIQINDVLDTTFHFIQGSAKLGDNPFPPVVSGQHLSWRIDSVGSSYHATILYLCDVGKPDRDTITALSKTTAIYFVGDSSWNKLDTATTRTRIGLAERGDAINYVLSGLLFESGKADLRSSMYASLQAASDLLRQYPDAMTVIEGHTDSRPIHTDQFPSNLELSYARADSVMNYFVTHFQFPQSSFQAYGWGERKPIATNETDEGRQANRRVEVRIFRGSFMRGKMLEGYIDSSIVLHNDIMPPEEQDSVTTAYTGDQLLIKLHVDRIIDELHMPTTVVDTLPPGFKLVENTFKKQEGIDSIVTNGNVIKAMCTEDDTTAEFTFRVKTVPAESVEDAYTHGFVVQRAKPTGDLIIDHGEKIKVEVEKYNK
jgi:uncharacterized repeat protein (TIGR01451 family)